EDLRRIACALSVSIVRLVQPDLRIKLKRASVCAMVSDMRISKTITGRELKRGTPEERLAPGEALRVKKSSGKEFLIVRETAAPDLADLHAEILRDIPLKGAAQKTNLAAWHEEDED